VKAVNSFRADASAQVFDAKPANAYPGAKASPAQICELAHQYRQAAELLVSLGRSGKPHTWAPFRLAAIHAIELYLNAFLLSSGMVPDEIRGMQHNLKTRTEAAMAAGLALRVRTTKHLLTLNEKREYLATRYGPELVSQMSNINRLSATLGEIAQKVASKLK
jgi:hypothetical protein